MPVLSMQNPWQELPTEPSYVLPKDKVCIDLHRPLLKFELRLDTLPEPYVGGLNKAEVIFLALNPGFDDSDIIVNLNMPKFIKANYINRNDPYNSPFYYFDGGFEETGGYKWWAKKLGPLLRAGILESTLRDKIMLIEYLPYHSKNAKKIKNLVVPSQQFSFDLVREAIRRKKIIVIMRSPELWLKEVPELENNSVTLNSWLNVIISPNNIGELNFNRILTKLT